MLVDDCEVVGVLCKSLWSEMVDMVLIGVNQDYGGQYVTPWDP